MIEKTSAKREGREKKGGDAGREAGMPTRWEAGREEKEKNEGRERGREESASEERGGEGVGWRREDGREDGRPDGRTEGRKEERTFQNGILPTEPNPYTSGKGSEGRRDEIQKKTTKKGNERDEGGQ
jgi:hypothetical protein